jgi:hypothetical protein
MLTELEQIQALNKVLNYKNDGEFGLDDESVFE